MSIFEKMYVTAKKYCVYIITNYIRKVLYTGITNNLEQRIIEHYLQRGNPTSFTGKYHVYYLLYFECFDYVNNAIAREKEIKNWRRSRKEKLITEFNPDWDFLNEKLFGKWPPDKLFHRKDSFLE
jgi:putative endonuclease